MGNNINKWILYCLAGVVLLYVFMPEIFPAKKYQAPKELLNRIDSLEKANQTLRQEFDDYDTMGIALQQEIENLDFRLGSIKGKTTIIKEIYKQKSDKVQSFTPTQVDSFFRDRYKY